MKNIIVKKDGPYSVNGGVLTSGDVNAYRLLIDMGTDTSNLSAMAICQENGEFSADYSAEGTKIWVVLANSMYKDAGYITVRLAVSDADSVLTAKEVVFRVVNPNNADTIAETHQGTISNILTSVQTAKTAAETSINISNQALAISKNKPDFDSVYTKEEIDSKISSVYKFKGSVSSYFSIPDSPSTGDTYNVTTDCNFPVPVKSVTITGVTDEWENTEWVEIDFAEDEELNSIANSIGSDILFRLYKSNGDFVCECEKGFGDIVRIRDHILPEPGKYYIKFITPDAFVYHTEQAKILKVKAGDNVAWTGTEWDLLSGTVDLSAYATKDYIDSKIGLALEGEY